MQTVPSRSAIPAVYAQAAGDVKSAFWNASFLRAWPDFEGTASDLQGILASGGVRLIDGRLTLQGLFDLTDGNLDEDPLLASAARTTIYSLGASLWDPPRRNELALDWRNYSHADRMDAPDYDLVENSFRFRWRRIFFPYELTLNSSLSASLDRLNDVSALRHGHEASITRRPDDHSEYGASLRYDGWSTPGQLVSNTLGWGLAAAHGDRRTRWQAHARNSYSFAASGAHRDLGVRHRGPRPSLPLGPYSLGVAGLLRHLLLVRLDSVRVADSDLQRARSTFRWAAGRTWPS